MWNSLNKLKESTKSAFSRVKEHNLMLENAIKEDRKLLIEQNKVILHLKSEIELLMNEFNNLKDYLSDYTSSSGNEGVINNHQQSSTTIINSQQSSTVNSNQQLNNANPGQKEHFEPEFSEPTMINNHQQLSITKDNALNNDQQSSTMINEKIVLDKEQDLKRPLSDIKKDLEIKFRGLTDREFSVFMAVYQLEEQLPDVNYSDVSKLLNISEMTVRGYVNSLLIKKIPLEKRRMYNKKVFLAIPLEFRELNLASFLLTLRLPNAHFVPQKTLKNF